MVVCLIIAFIDTGKGLFIGVVWGIVAAVTVPILFVSILVFFITINKKNN